MLETTLVRSSAKLSARAVLGDWAPRFAAVTPELPHVRRVRALTNPARRRALPAVVVLDDGRTGKILVNRVQGSGGSFVGNGDPPA